MNTRSAAKFHPWVARALLTVSKRLGLRIILYLANDFMDSVEDAVAHECS